MPEYYDLRAQGWIELSEDVTRNALIKRIQELSGVISIAWTGFCEHDLIAILLSMMDDTMDDELEFYKLGIDYSGWLDR